jgi:hypothetical protein
MIDLHLSLKNILKVKKFRIRRRIRSAKNKRVGGAFRKSYKNRAFTQIYMLTCY